MEKINFINQSAPALNATNLNKLQDNVEDLIKTEQTTSEEDTYCCNYINKIKGIILWENSSPSSSFTSQNITLSESLSNYDYYSIIYKNKTDEDKYYNTGKIPVGHGCRLTEIYASAVSYGIALRERQISYTNSTTLSAENGSFASAGSSKTQDNDICIPISIIGY